MNTDDMRNEARAIDDVGYTTLCLKLLKAADEIDALRAKLAEQSWQPIEGAPKDGTCILLLTAEGIIEGYWDSGTWGQNVCECNYDMASAHLQCKPTHWMPLPQPPEESNE